MISFVDSIQQMDQADGRPWIEAIRGDEPIDEPEKVAYFATVSSPFYPQLEAYYRWRNAQWLAKAQAERDAGAADG